MSTASIAGATGFASGSGVAYTGKIKNVPVRTKKASKPPAMRRTQISSG
jgi:hypothetical protein